MKYGFLMAPLLFLVTQCNIVPCLGQSAITSFENVNVIPVNRDTILYNQRVIVAEGKILSIAPASQPPVLKIGRRINAAGKFLIPAFTDIHFHHETSLENEFKLLIANGITCVTNMAERPGQDPIAIRAQARRGKMLAPEYFTTGPYLKANDLTREADAVKIVKMHKQRGYDFIKIADNLDKKVYLKLLEEAGKNHIPVVGHGQRALPLEYTLRMKLLAHLEELIYILTDSQQRDSTFLRKTAKQIKASGIYVSPTLGVFDMITNYTDPIKYKKLQVDPILDYLPPALKATWLSENQLYRSNAYLSSAAGIAWAKEKLKWQMNFARMLNEEGVSLMVGTDATGMIVNGFSIHHEFELMKAAGFSNYDILKCATLTPARYLDRIALAGSIEEGKLADVVLLDKNPLEDILNTRSIRGVMLKGIWLSREKLDNLLLEVKTSVKTNPVPSKRFR